MCCRKINLAEKCKTNYSHEEMEVAIQRSEPVGQRHRGKFERRNIIGLGNLKYVNNISISRSVELTNISEKIGTIVNISV